MRVLGGGGGREGSPLLCHWPMLSACADTDMESTLIWVPYLPCRRVTCTKDVISSQGGSCTHWVHLISVRGLDGCDERAGEFPEMGK